VARSRHLTSGEARLEGAPDDDRVSEKMAEATFERPYRRQVLRGARIDAGTPGVARQKTCDAIGDLART
jgi:hypothetical protein